MGEQDQQTRQRLLRCAKAEFLSRGFEHASLRRICEAAGVTTGAVYFFFQNKEDLFAQIVQDTAQQLTQLGRELASEELEHPDTGPDCDLRFMAFLYHHREEALLLLEGAKGTRYASFREELYDTMRSAFSLFFHRYGAPDADAELIRIGGNADEGNSGTAQRRVFYGTCAAADPTDRNLRRWRFSVPDRFLTKKQQRLKPGANAPGFLHNKT